MLDAKGVAYERVDLFPALSMVWLRLTGFGAGTVPALRLDGVRVQGSRAIARALDASCPEPHRGNKFKRHIEKAPVSGAFL